MLLCTQYFDIPFWSKSPGRSVKALFPKSFQIKPWLILNFKGMVEVTFIVVYLVFFFQYSRSASRSSLVHTAWKKVRFGVFLVRIFFPFFLLQKFYIVFYPSYVSICKDLQKTIVLPSDPFLQIFTFTIQCICNLWWIESSPSEAIQYTQKHDSNKAADMHLCWNHTTAWVPPPLVDSPHMP